MLCSLDAAIRIVRVEGFPARCRSLDLLMKKALKRGAGVANIQFRVLYCRNGEWK